MYDRAKVVYLTFLMISTPILGIPALKGYGRYCVIRNCPNDNEIYRWMLFGAGANCLYTCLVLIIEGGQEQIGGWLFARCLLQLFFYLHACWGLHQFGKLWNWGLAIGAVGLVGWMVFILPDGLRPIFRVFA